MSVPVYPAWRSLPREQRRAINRAAWVHVTRLGVPWLVLRAEMALRVVQGMSAAEALAALEREPTLALQPLRSR